MQMLGYYEWLKFYGIEQELEPCDCCSGTGNDECNSCGGEIECHNCDGSGEVDETRKEYNNIRTRTERLIAKSNKELKEGHTCLLKKAIE